MADIEIKSNTIDAAAGEILGILDGISKHERNIFFYGWRGLGASAALRVASQRLKSQAAKGRKFDKVVHVDCTLWQSMRALQKAVAEELELPQSVMAIFDQHDEEDDLKGIDQGSRGVISEVREEIFRKLAGSTFVVFFHNGSNHYIDLYECGVPVTTFLSNRVVWTWGGGFHLLYRSLGRQLLDENNEVDVFVGSDEWQDHVLHEEAAEVAKCMGILDPDKIVECFQYVWARRLVSCIDWEMHASNYWVCDGIIQEQDNTSAWDVGDALQRNIHLDWIMEDIFYIEEIGARISSPQDRWVAVTHQALLHDDIVELTPQATSFFLLEDESDGRSGRRVVLPAAMFPDNNRLRVLHLSWCTFSFTSPPFFYCSHLRFLLLDHCTDVRDEEHESNNQSGSCFQKLWVLDLRYTDWYSKKLMSLMDDLRELNVERVKDWMSIADLCGNKTSLVKLRVTADPDSATEIVMQGPVLNMSKASHLKTVILENCVGLEQVVPDALPPLLESFSFIISDAVIAKICSISFQGLAKLKSVLLRGLMGALEELDLSGTGVKTLDLREVVALNLKRLILLGCEKLKAIQWPSSDERTKKLEVLRINTIQSASSGQANWEEKANETSVATGSSCIVTIAATKPAAYFNRYISVRDARLLRSLVPVRDHFGNSGGHLEMDSSPASGVVVGDSESAQGIRQRQPGHYLYARDIIFQDHMRAVAANEGAIKWMWTFPPVPTVDDMGWYVHIQDKVEMTSGLLLQQQGSTQGTGSALIPNFIRDNAKTLHVHDSLSITSIASPLGFSWRNLKWCRIERCPKLSSVFATPTESYDDSTLSFYCLTTFWASKLPMARYIWNWSTIWQPERRSFEDLKFLHIDYCPRLIHVLPLSVHMTDLGDLETLEIVCCGDLMEIFPLDPERQEEQTVIDFPNLKRIHLHDLPSLQRICGSKMFAPKLETIKIRGCWSLRHLPAVAKQCPMVDCEKDWWDSLEWDEGDANHHPSLYQTTHSRYYKKAQLPRGTVLR